VHGVRVAVVASAAVRRGELLRLIGRSSDLELAGQPRQANAGAVRSRMSLSASRRPGSRVFSTLADPAPPGPEADLWSSLAACRNEESARLRATFPTASPIIVPQRQLPHRGPGEWENSIERQHRRGRWGGTAMPRPIPVRPPSGSRRHRWWPPPHRAANVHGGGIPGASHLDCCQLVAERRADGWFVSGDPHSGRGPSATTQSLLARKVLRAPALRVSGLGGVHRQQPESRAGSR